MIGVNHPCSAHDDDVLVVIQIYFIMVCAAQLIGKNPFIIPAGILIFAACQPVILNDVNLFY